jgi:DNA polymerase-3 subunit delta
MAKKSAKPVIVLVGEEQYLKNEQMQSILDSLQAEAHAEVSEFDGKEASVTVVLDELRTYPFLNPHRVIIVRNANALFPAGTPGEEPLLRYIENPVDFSTLILDFGKLDGRSKLAKALKKYGREMRFERMREYQVPQWLVSRAQKRYGKRLSAADASFMVEMVGTNPGLLDSELSKIASLSPGLKAIQRSEVERVITRGRAQTVFRLTERVEAKRGAEALKLLDDILSRGIYDERAGSVSTEGTGIAPYLLHMLNWSLGRLWGANRLLAEGKSEDEVAAELRLHQRFKQQFIDNLRKLWPVSECRRCHRELLLADRLIKVSSGEVGVLLETLIVKLCGRAKVRGRGAR